MLWLCRGSAGFDAALCAQRQVCFLGAVEELQQVICRKYHQNTSRKHVSHFPPCEEPPLTTSLLCRYGELMDVNLVRDQTTGKSKGFAFLAYEDQRSTVLAVGESASSFDKRDMLSWVQSSQV